MAIVEDKVRSDSEEDEELDHDLEVVGEELPDSTDSEYSDDDDDAVDSALESKASTLESQLKADLYSYDDHVELVKVYWALSDLERWRTASDRFINTLALKPEDWLLRLRTEISLCMNAEADSISKLFEKALDDCYSMEILSEWCSWALSLESATSIRQQLKKIVAIAGADPLSGKVFWDALYEFEKAQLDSFTHEEQNSDECSSQRERLCRVLEETVSRPLLHGKDAWPLYAEVAATAPAYGAEYVARTLKDHEQAQTFLEKLTPFEDRLLTLENGSEEKLKVYEDYIQALEILCDKDEIANSRDYVATLKTVYARATSDCPSLGLLRRFAAHARRRHSAATHRRVLQACARRSPRTHHFWTALMQDAEREHKSIDEVHSYFETALMRGMETFKEGELLWLSYIEYKRRQTNFAKPEDVNCLRSTFRLAWDSLATCYGDEANDSEVPLFWARLEYQRMQAPREGREVIEEIFKYGENKTMSKYWEALLRLEMSRSPPLAENKLRDLFRRALTAVTDYPPAVGAIWTDYERDHGDLDSMEDCTRRLEKKIEEWRDYYKKMKEKMSGKKNNKHADNKKNKFDNKNKPNAKKQDNRKQNANAKDNSKVIEKRKSDGGEGSSDVKRKRDSAMEVDEGEKASTSQGVKRSHGSDGGETENKKPKIETEDSRERSREACTLFVSNLDFKVDEQKLRDTLSQYGDIVSLRIRSGVKSFGGSICYCQYRAVSSVDEALKHDRSLLDGRPMFFAAYSEKKSSKPQFKYATSQEKNKLFVKNLPFAQCKKEELTAIFEPHGKLNDIRIVTHKDGRVKGLAYVDYADEESAAKAIAATNGMLLGERRIEVAISAPPPKGEPPVSLGQPKRDVAGGMRRTQLSSFVPSVLLKATAATSKPAVPSEVNKPKSNSDFRNLLLAKKQ